MNIGDIKYIAYLDDVKKLEGKLDEELDNIIKKVEDIIENTPDVFHDVPQSSITEDMTPSDFDYGLTLCGHGDVSNFPSINDYGVSITLRGKNISYAQFFVTRHGDIWSRRSATIDEWNGEWYNAKKDIKRLQNNLTNVEELIEDKADKKIIGDLSQLTTADKTSIVNAINELNNLEQDKPLIYGFEIDENNSNPRTAVRYIGDNAGFTPAKVSNLNSWEEMIKDLVTPVVLKNGKTQYELQHNNRTKKKDGSSAVLTGADGDVMIRFKHLWVKEEKVASRKRRVWLSDAEFDGAVSYTKMTERGYTQLSWGLLMTLQHLYLLLYKDRDSQTALGRGYVDGNSNFTNTGGTNTKSFCFGETTGKQQIAFLGIEDFWGNKFQWVDGIVSDSNYNLKIGYNDFNDSGSNYKLIRTPQSEYYSGYFKTTMGGEAGYILADDGDGSSSTGYCDYGNLHSGNVAHFGGGRNHESSTGAFHVQLNYSASDAYSSYVARLCFVDDDYFYVGAYLGYVQDGKLRSISGKEPTGNEAIGKFREYAEANN